MSNIPIFLSSDNNFAPYVATTMASVLKNTKSFVEFYILEDEISETNKNRILNLKKHFKNLSIEFINIDINKYFSALPELPCISKSMYSRLLIPLLKKVIYSDVDVIFNKDVKSLYYEDLAGYIIGAVEEYRIKEIGNCYLERVKRLNLKGFKSLFLSSPLVIDVEKWNSDNITGKLLTLASGLALENKLVFPDMDVLNKYFDGDFKKLDKKYCVIPKALKWNFSNKEIKKIYKGAVSFHYAGNGDFKPWNNKKIEGAKYFWNIVGYTDFVQILKQNLKNGDSSFWPRIFSVKNEIKNGAKIKVVSLFGLKIIRFRLNKPKIDNNCLNILVEVSGGFGDILINANYVYHIAKLLNKTCNKNFRIDITACEKHFDKTKAVFGNCTYINNCFMSDNHVDDCIYDLSIFINNLPSINYCNYEKLKRFSQKLYEYILDFKNFQNRYYFPYFYHLNSYNIALANNQHRLQLADPYGYLEIGKEFDCPIPYPENENEILKNFDLSGKNFITINRGVDKNNYNAESTKMWALSRFDELVRLIKLNYNDVVLVQVGASTNKCRNIGNIDINLVGKTNLEDIKVLIKNSILHIDCEGGFAHLRNALKASHPAVVIFGPTNPDLYAYDSNINIYNKGACSICCDWVYEDWQNCCLRGEKNPPCTFSVSCEQVYKEVDKYLKKCGLKEKIYAEL